MSKKITNRVLTDKFIEAFEGDKKFTPSEKRLMGIQCTQVRKAVKEYLEEANIETALSVNEIILDTIEYSIMMNYKYRRFSSLGYDVLGKSIEYWEKRRKIEKDREHKKTVEKVESEKFEIESEGYTKNNHNKKAPKWLKLD